VVPGGHAAMATPAGQLSEPVPLAHLGPLARPVPDTVAAARITTARIMTAGSMAARRVVAAEMVAAVMAIRAEKAALGVTTMAAGAGTPPGALAAADLATVRRRMVRVHPTTGAGPVLARERMSRALSADPGAQPAVAGSGPTATGQPGRARPAPAAGKAVIGRRAAVARVSVRTGRAAIGRSAVSGRAVIGRRARTSKAAATGTGAAAGRAAAVGSRATSVLATTGLGAEVVPPAPATTGLEAEMVAPAPATTGLEAEMVPPAPATTGLRADEAGELTTAAARPVRAALVLLGARIPAVATARLAERMHAGLAKMRRSWICQRASPQTS
jgi:hypothetical protein